MLVKILIVVAVVVVLLIIVVATRPPTFRVVRSAMMSAPPAVIFEQVNDLHKWQAWSPWENIDPNLKRTYEGSQAGQGAVYRWVGNNKVGEGGMTITESRPSDLITIRLDFLKPFKSTNTAEFTFKPQGNQTEVTWSMSGCNRFCGKLFGLFMSMDKMIGGSFEQGLAKLKSNVEAKG